MSRTFNHRTSKSSWKKACKKQANRSIRYSAITEISGCSAETVWKMEEALYAQLDKLSAEEAQELFDFIDMHVEETISICPKVAKFRFYMD